MVERVGKPGDGGKWLCDPHRLVPSRCVVYSFGSAWDTSFEEDIFRLKQCEVHIFDPTVDLPASPRYTFHKLGISDKTGTIEKVGPVDTLANIARDLGHTHIDVLKVDVEYHEWTGLRDWIQNVDAFHFGVGQLSVEVHAPPGNSRGMAEWISGLEARGMYQFAFEPNFCCDGMLAELGFVNLTWAFGS